MSFEPRTKDFTLSPYTGLTRESWLEAASYIIDGVFAHIKKFEAASSQLSRVSPV